jgi:hypothetical protein
MSSPLWVANKHTSSYVEEASKAAESAQMISKLVREQEEQISESPKPFRRGLLENLKSALISPLFVDMPEVQQIRVSSISPRITNGKLKE